ncbi:MAG: NAD(P)-dependent alcohol dehydrogenase [Cryobacterium sp.]|nr:NAD(P)-dependent alcohol dehydrogenase [Cryobacterium sp.]MBX3310499.1 NAD(P)-dependent alcohol dehydrogenase [Cryobacterium sp.]
MKAVVQDKYGSADVLELRDVERPTPSEDEVLVRVKAAGVNMADWHMMAGKPTIMRLFGVGFRAPKQRIRGSDVAGVVEEVGSEVTQFVPGDEVFGSARGAFAEFATARVKRLLPKPEGVSFEQAAAVSMVGYTALQALRADDVSLDALGGQRILVIGAAGGVGSMTVQLAKHFGATVTGVCSTAKVALVRSLGADDVIDYVHGTLQGTYDVIVDTAGNRSLGTLRRRLTPKGRLVIVGGEGGGSVLGALKRNLRAAAMGPFTGQKLIGLMAMESPDDLAIMRDLLASGAITAPIERTFSLAEAADAIRHLEAGRAMGKVVVVP